MSRWMVAAGFAVALSSAGCGSDVVKESEDGGEGKGTANGGTSTDAGVAPGDDAGGSKDGGGGVDAGSGAGDGGGSDGGQKAGFAIRPPGVQILKANADGTAQSVTFEASLDGKPISVGWNVDRGEIGTLDSGEGDTSVFTPSGKAGGLVTVRAGLNGEVLERIVWVQLEAAQNGADPDSELEQRQIADDEAQLKEGGGVGGVGGEGLGGPVDDAALRDLLDNPTDDGTSVGLAMQYPYDATVWPRGMLAPLLMWESTLGGVDAIKIELATRSGSYAWSGTFGAPSILAQTGDEFVRHPIPQEAWATATNTAGGPTLDGKTDTLQMRLTVAKGDASYGPLTQTWTVAPARLAGTIYYSSYGTNLAKNYDGAKAGGKFGGAVLSIRVGDTGPSLVAGKDGGASECRVCHSVSADGSRLFAPNQNESFAYAITPQDVVEEKVSNSEIEYPGLTPDGRYALTSGAQLLDLENAGAPMTISGLTEVATNVGTASFSPDGTRVAFNPMASGSLSSPRSKVVVMDFDANTLVFSNPVTVVDESAEANAEVRPGWPTFSPDGAVIFHQQIAAGVDGNDHGALHTRKGAKAYLAWTTGDGSEPRALDRLNGLSAGGNSYLPSLVTPIALTCTADGVQVGDIDADHASDAELNYEPTVNPVASGGYAWVVFTSRRMYGSVANIPPYCSDPRGVDLIENVTTKKLWVAAIDLNAEAGTDPSHPAFYLPAQELLAGNTRGSWVLDPCRADGDSCETGDQCCGGFCAADENGVMMCANEPPAGQCSATQERCEGTEDCCDPTNVCINNFCSYVPLQ